MRILWQCLDCGDHGLKIVGWASMKDERAWKSVQIVHDQQNPGCTAGPDGMRAREESDDEMDARLRAG